MICSVWTAILTSLLCLWCVCGKQVCPRCLRLALAEGKTVERAGSPYLARLQLAAAQQERSPLRVAPQGKVIVGVWKDVVTFCFARFTDRMEHICFTLSSIEGKQEINTVTNVFKMTTVYAIYRKLLLLSHFPSPSCRWRRAPELGRAANVSHPQSTHLSQRHHPYTQVLSHLLGQWERSQAAVPTLLSETDPAHRVSAAQDLPSSHQDRLHQPKPSVVLAARHSAGGSQLSDWRWGQCGEMVSPSKFSDFLVSLRSWKHLCKITAKEILSLPAFPFLLALSISLCVLSLSRFPLPLPLLQMVSSPFEIKVCMQSCKLSGTLQLCRNPDSVFKSDPFWFLHRPAHAVKHSSVRGQRRLRLCPETSGAVGPKLSDVSAVLSDGEGCGKNESRPLLPHCESRGGLTPSSTLLWSVFTLFPLFICGFMLYLLFHWCKE